MLKSVWLLMQLYKKEGGNQRLGQFFCNKYVKYSWPELFYEEQTDVAIRRITVYLTHLQYIYELPPELPQQ